MTFNIGDLAISKSGRRGVIKENLIGYGNLGKGWYPHMFSADDGGTWVIDKYGISPVLGSAHSVSKLPNKDLGTIYMYLDDNGNETINWSDDINDIDIGRKIHIVAHNATESEYDMVVSAIKIYSKL